MMVENNSIWRDYCKTQVYYDNSNTKAWHRFQKLRPNHWGLPTYPCARNQVVRSSGLQCWLYVLVFVLFLTITRYYGLKLEDIHQNRNRNTNWLNNREDSDSKLENSQDSWKIGLLHGSWRFILILLALTLISNPPWVQCRTWQSWYEDWDLSGCLFLLVGKWWFCCRWGSEFCDEGDGTHR